MIRLFDSAFTAPFQRVQLASIDGTRDLNEAIHHARSALILCSTGKLDWFESLVDLALHLSIRFNQLEDFDKAILPTQDALVRRRRLAKRATETGVRD